MLKELPSRAIILPEVIWQGVKWYWEKPGYISDIYPNLQVQAILEKTYVAVEKEFENFPYFCCEDASLRVKELGIGLKMVFGRFETDIDRIFKKPGQAHWWCIDLSGAIIDFTASQFNGMMWGKNRISEGVYILNRSHPLYRRFVPGGFDYC